MKWLISLAALFILSSIPADAACGSSSRGRAGLFRGRQTQSVQRVTISQRPGIFRARVQTRGGW